MALLYAVYWFRVWQLYRKLCAMRGASSVEIDVVTGLIRGVRYVASPNQDARPEGASLDLLVVHGISLPPGEFQGEWVERLFLNELPPDRHPYFAAIAQLKVSAHLYIRRDGSMTQFVPWHRRAWHAGVSSWRNRLGCNDFSVGIELEGADEIPYEPVQYAALAAVSRELLRVYPTLAADAVVGHSDIAPSRKTDPGPAFDWQHFRRLLAD